ncbi:hypothetical protein P9VFCI_014 [Rhizobium phage P9VFCI]|uniref:Uncharacterized protein n=1 Tax=Rhizobium phage P9VFCI TaxID=2763531 RepID=A0A7G7WXM3_9CAUD|nr:hypothetical protein PP937_gp014 [Rhizobium phage P9VFCI]QNH71967.1 hypothetical protein P9VFCI_014 [Rhizobium phage P9VFCI]
MSDHEEVKEKDIWELRKCCISCEYYSSGHNECRRFPPVPVKYTSISFQGYDRVENEALAWMYPNVEVDHPICGEHVMRPQFRGS